MCQITLEVPNEALLALKLNQEQLGREIPLLAAMKLYELGKLSSCAAAKFAGISRPLFLLKMGDYGVSTFDFSREEMLKEVQLADNNL